MKKITIFLSSLFILFAGIAVLSCSNGPEPILPPDPYDGPTYEVKFEVVETEYWWKANDHHTPIRIIDKSDVDEEVIEYTESHKPSFETKILNENEEYVLENYNKWMFGNEEDPDLKFEVQYFANEDLTSPIEPGSVIKNENKIIYVKFIWYLYKDSYTIYFR